MSVYLHMMKTIIHTEYFTWILVHYYWFLVHCFFLSCCCWTQKKRLLRPIDHRKKMSIYTHVHTKKNKISSMNRWKSSLMMMMMMIICLWFIWIKIHFLSMIMMMMMMMFNPSITEIIFILNSRCFFLNIRITQQEMKRKKAKKKKFFFVFVCKLFNDNLIFIFLNFFTRVICGKKNWWNRNPHK